MYCNKCGRKNDDDAVYCQKCGRLLEAEDETRVVKRNIATPAAPDDEPAIFNIGPTLKFIKIGYGLAVVGGKQTASYAPATMAALGAGATVGFLLPMSRAQESEADHIGLILMALAGYDPHEAIHLWERMRARSGDRKAPEWLSTHPADESRLADIKRWMPEAMKYYRPHGRSTRD